MKIFYSALLASCLIACASTQKATERNVTFSCTNGETVSVRFQPDDDMAVLTRHHTDIELQQQPSASGFIYSNGPNTIRGKGDELIVEIGRMVPIQCKAINNH